MSGHAGHPWQLTLHEHSERISSEYGKEAAGAFLELAKLYGISPGEELEPEVLRSLLIGAGIPVLDFGLDPEPGVLN